MRQVATELRKHGYDATITGKVDWTEGDLPQKADIDAYLYDIAPQLGARCSRRLTGEYVMSANDWAFAHEFEDVIAWHSTICSINDCGPVEIPYRAIVPQKVEGLLCPGRHISADDVESDPPVRWYWPGRRRSRGGGAFSRYCPAEC